MKRTVFTNVVDVLCLVLMAGSVVYLLAVWGDLPDRVPIHYGPTGKADGWGSKWDLWHLPCVMLASFAIASIVECFPKTWNTGGIKITEENRDRIYALLRNMLSTVKLLVVALFSFLSVACGRGGDTIPIGMLFATAAGFTLLLFANIAFWWVKMYRNR